MAGTFELKRSGDQFIWNLKAGNGEIIATSERYTTNEAAKNGIESVKANAPGASTKDETRADANRASPTGPPGVCREAALLQGSAGDGRTLTARFIGTETQGRSSNARPTLIQRVPLKSRQVFDWRPSHA